jgi:hypothetical protein
MKESRVKCREQLKRASVIYFTHHELIDMSGIGAHVKNTVMRRKNFLPHTSERAPMRGADKKEKMPLIPITSPFMRNV